MVFWYHSAYGLCLTQYDGPLVAISSWMSASSGAQPGTEYRPQWMKMPNLASPNHPGTDRFSNDSLTPRTLFTHGLTRGETSRPSGVFPRASRQPLQRPF